LSILDFFDNRSPFHVASGKFKFVKPILIKYRFLKNNHHVYHLDEFLQYFHIHIL